MPDPNQEYNGPYTEAHLQDGTILKFKGDLDPISVKQKVATFKAGIGSNATKPELPKPEFSAGSSEGWMQDPENKVKLDQSIAADTTMGAGGAALGNSKFVANAPRAIKWGVDTAKTLAGMKALGYIGDKLGIPYASVAALTWKPGEQPEEPPPDNINYERNQQLNRKTIGSVPANEEYRTVGPATGSAPSPKPIPGVPQPTPEPPPPPADTIDYERNKRLNRANLTRSIGSTEPSGPATGVRVPTPHRLPSSIGEPTGTPPSGKGVQVVPEPRGPIEGAEWSVPREEAADAARRGNRSGFEVQRRLGKPMVIAPESYEGGYTPSGRPEASAPQTVGTPVTGLPTEEELSNAIAKKTNDPVFADKRAKQLIEAANGKPGYSGPERRAARTQIGVYVGPERRR